MAKGTKRWRGVKKKADNYSGRNMVLRKAGFQSYRDYLASSIWSSIRSRVLERDRGQCKLCKTKACAIHHRFYSRSNLKGSNLSGLVSVCPTCHRFIEFDTTGNKRTLADSEAAYRRLEGIAARVRSGDIDF